jgi:hypothetical protein
MMRMEIEQGLSGIMMEMAQQIESKLTPLMRMEIEQGLSMILMEMAQ